MKVPVGPVRADHGHPHDDLGPLPDGLGAAVAVQVGGGVAGVDGHDPEPGKGLGVLPVTLDCDVLTVDGSDLRVIVYTADPASADAGRLSLVRTIGLQGVSPGTGRW